MKTLISIIAITMGHCCCGQTTNSLAQAVNSYWVSSNYTAIIQVVDAALQRDPHDLLALCLKHGYYMSVEEDFEKAKTSAAQLVTEVDGRIQNPKGAVYDLAKAIATMSHPDSPRPTQLVNPERMAYRHKNSPDKFPFMDMYEWFSQNLALFENKEGSPNQGLLRTGDPRTARQSAEP